MWNYLPYAIRLIEEIVFLTDYVKNDFHLIGGENGEFSVWKDNEQIYERKECTDPFPSGVDIVRLL